MNKVFINGRFLAQQFTGVQRYAYEVVRALDGLIVDSEIPLDVELLVPHKGAKELPLRNIRVRRAGLFSGVAWEQFDLPRVSASGILLNLGSTGPIAHRRQLVTMHDASVFRIPENFSAVFRYWYRFLFPVLGRRARRILTVSNFSKHELSRCAHIPPHKIAVIRNAAAHIIREPADNSVVSATGLQPKSYVLCAGAGIANKNFGLVLRALELMRSDLHLVHFGKADSGVFSELPPISRARIHELGFVTDQQLRALYENAFCFVFPSLYEGFGIPPLEAMLCLCPAIVANTAALPETCGDAVLYCNPHDARDLASKLSMLADQPQLAERLIKAGASRARDYTWEECGRAILRELQAVAQEEP